MLQDAADATSSLIPLISCRDRCPPGRGKIGVNFRRRLLQDNQVKAGAVQSLANAKLDISCQDCRIFYRILLNMRQFPGRSATARAHHQICLLAHNSRPLVDGMHAGSLQMSYWKLQQCRNCKCKLQRSHYRLYLKYPRYDLYRHITATSTCMPTRPIATISYSKNVYMAS
jgi:hypothetical protein